MAKEAETKQSKEKSAKLENIYEVFERELNRPLSPLEFQLIGEWLEAGNSDERIIEAMRTALSKGKKTLKAIDKVLQQWTARDDIEKVGYSAQSETWDKDIEETMKIVKTKWID